jgi:hypothetical protein
MRALGGVRERIQIGERPFAPGVGLDSSEHVQEVVVVRVHVVAGLESHRREQLQVATQEREPRRQHADHRVRLGVDRQALADHRRTGAEAPAPQPIGDDHDSMRAPALVVGDESASELRRRAERREEA